MNTALVAQARIDTPLGPMTAAATAGGIAGLWFDGQRHHPGALDAPDDEDNAHLAQLRRELAAYWASGGRARFAVALDAQGTPFQRRVWQALRALGPGQLEHYGALAARLRQPRAARAVGAAVGRNPVSIVVPCHRVLGSAGALTGYAGGLARKRALLEHEGALPELADAPARARCDRTRRPTARGRTG
ncbi:MAG: methylated-DNA--[protein]-cysteine S-methyltransferase [Rubrivivax sp.]